MNSVVQRLAVVRRAGRSPPAGWRGPEAAARGDHRAWLRTPTTDRQWQWLDCRSTWFADKSALLQEAVRRLQQSNRRRGDVSDNQPCQRVFRRCRSWPRRIPYLAPRGCKSACDFALRSPSSTGTYPSCSSRPRYQRCTSIVISECMDTYLAKQPHRQIAFWPFTSWLQITTPCRLRSGSRCQTRPNQRRLS